MKKHNIPVFVIIVVAVLQGEYLAAATTTQNSNSVAMGFINLDFESGSTTGARSYSVYSIGLWLHLDVIIPMEMILKVSITALPMLVPANGLA